MRHFVLWEKLAGQVFRQLGVFSGANFMSLTLVSPYVYKSTKILSW